MGCPVYRPNPIGSSAMASSSVGALLPLRFFEYHKNVIDDNAFTENTNHAKYTAYPYLLQLYKNEPKIPQREDIMNWREEFPKFAYV